MTNFVSFPGLGLDFQINPIAFSIGSLHIYWYGIIATLGIGLAIYYCFKRCNQFGIQEDPLTDVILIGVISGIVGARIYYVAFSWDYYSQHLNEIWRIHEGGIAIYGAIIGGALGIYLACRYKKMKVLPLFDLVAAPLLLGQGIGRWGNFVNVEAFGGNTTLPWGMTSPKITAYLERMSGVLEGQGMAVDATMPVHPTFFYESCWLILGFILLAWYTNQRRFDGELTLMFGAWNGLGRVVIEGLRTDSLMLGGVRISQVLAGLAVVICILMLVRFRKRAGQIPLTTAVLVFDPTEEVTISTEESAEEQIEISEMVESEEKIIPEEPHDDLPSKQE